MTVPQPFKRASPSERIDGWKSIAAHFGRDRTTVVRWARERGLPVHRLPGGQIGTVYALRHELEAWASGAALARADLVPPLPTVQTEPAPAASPATRGWRPTRPVVVGLIVIFLIALGLSLALSRSPDTPTDAPRLPADPKVAHTYLTARDLVAERNAQSIERGLALLEQVVAQAPGYAPGQVALGEALILSREFGVRSDREAFDRARAAASAALRLEAELPSAERLVGFIAYWADGDFAEADRRFRRALALDPTDAITPFWYGNVLSDHGNHAQALKLLDRARLLQPGPLAIRTDFAWARWAAGDPAGASELAELAHRYPDFAVIHECLAQIHYLRGDRARYVAHFARLAQLRGDPRLLAESAALRGAMGTAAIDRIALSQAVAALAQDRARSHVWAVAIASAMDDRAQVVALLQAADRRRERWGEAGIVTRLVARWRDDAQISALIARRIA